MRKLNLGIIFLTCLILLCPMLANSDDYFSRITVASDGRITRFAHSPISVYIASPDVQDDVKQAYIDDVEYSLDQWSTLSEGQLKFKSVESENADIRIFWTKNLLSSEGDPLGEASLVQFDQNKFYINVSILLKGIPTSATSIHKEIRTVALHEIGHAVGLWGHSKDPNDVMYFKTKAVYPTRRDKETLLKLLSSAPGSAFYDNAIAELKADISESDYVPHLHFWLGSVYADKGDDTLAIKELTYALKLDPNLLKAVDRLARIFQNEGMNQKAIQYYSKLAKREPSSGLFGMIGMLYFQQKDYSMAVDYFNRAFYLDNNNTAVKNNALTAYHLWACDLIKVGEADKAIAILDRARLRFPSSRVIYYDLGTAYDSKKQYEKAIEYYKKSLELESSFEPAKKDIAACMNNMGAEQIQGKNWIASIDLCKQALQWDPDCWQANKNLEIANLELGRQKQESGFMDEAIIYYSVAIVINPDNIDAHVGLGDAFYEKGLYRESIAHYQDALKIDPNQKDALDGIAFIKRLMNINRIRIVGFFVILSILAFFIAFLLHRFLRHKKPSNNRMMQSEH
jgi:tetratricopeptide (TPR) repeat protein